MTTFFAEERPRINGLPAYAYGALPSLTVTMLEGLNVRVSIMVAVELGSYAWKHVELPAEALPALIAVYKTDPEFCMREHFGYSPENIKPAAKPASKPQSSRSAGPSLEELGLL